VTVVVLQIPRHHSALFNIKLLTTTSITSPPLPQGLITPSQVVQVVVAVAVVVVVVVGGGGGGGTENRSQHVYTYSSDHHHYHYYHPPRPST